MKKPKLKVGDYIRSTSQRCTWLNGEVPLNQWAKIVEVNKKSNVLRTEFDGNLVWGYSEWFGSEFFSVNDEYMPKELYETKLGSLMR